jgi:hypothetical protein
MLDELVAALIALNCLLTLWIMRMIVHEMRLGVEQIDHQLAAAIQKVVEGNLGDFEPPNPIQQALAELLSNRIKNPAVIDVARDETGRFAKD